MGEDLPRAGQLLAHRDLRVHPAEEDVHQVPARLREARLQLPPHARQEAPLLPRAGGAGSAGVSGGSDIAGGSDGSDDTSVAGRTRHPEQRDLPAGRELRGAREGAGEGELRERAVHGHHAAVIAAEQHALHTRRRHWTDRRQRQWQCWWYWQCWRYWQCWWHGQCWRYVQCWWLGEGGKWEDARRVDETIVRGVEPECRWT